MRLLEYNGIKELPEVYLKAWADASKHDFFKGPDWYRVLEAATLDDGETCRIQVVEEESHGVGPVAMLLTRWDERKRQYGARRLLCGLTSPYSCEFGVVALGDPSRLEAGTKCIAAGLVAAQPRWDALRFDAMPKDTGEIDALERALRDAGFLVQPFFHFGNWYECVEGQSFDSYLENRPARLRNTLRRKQKKLTGIGDSRVHVYEHVAESARAAEAYETVYRQSWKRPEPHPEFVPLLITAAARCGCLRLGALYINEEPIAAQIWLVSGGRATIFKLAHVQHHEDLSAGTILTAAMIERILEENEVHEIDFGRGDDRYKKDWLSSRRERWGAVAFHPRTLRGLIGAARHVGVYKLRRLLAQNDDAV